MEHSNTTRSTDTPSLAVAPRVETPEVGAGVDYEPCAEFRADASEVAVCDGCGWLEDDHGTRAVAAA